MPIMLLTIPIKELARLIQNLAVRPPVMLGYSRSRVGSTRLAVALISHALHFSY
jgi:hypothetical protein